MTEFVASRPLAVGQLRDLAALGKPRLSMLVIFTSAIGVWLAPSQPGVRTTLLFLAATSTLVAAANTMNCWLEREIDRRMNRTRNRPLPAGRMDPRVALVFGHVLGSASLITLLVVTNPLTTVLGLIALLSYVMVYTPMKRISPWAVVVGAVPGAIPPLMGWTAATGSLDTPGWFLFGILFFWQLPHFIAISIYLKDDFRLGGIRVLPLVHGERPARIVLCATIVLLTAFSLVARPLMIAGGSYTWIALLAGLTWLALAAPGVRHEVSPRWARLNFTVSLVYLPVLVAVLVLDAV